MQKASSQLASACSSVLSPHPGDRKRAVSTKEIIKKDFNVIMLGILGLGFLLAGAFVATGYGEYILTFIGAFIIISGHLRNFRLCRKEGCEH